MVKEILVDELIMIRIEFWSMDHQGCLSTFSRCHL